MSEYNLTVTEDELDVLPDALMTAIAFHRNWQPPADLDWTEEEPEVLIAGHREDADRLDVLLAKVELLTE